MRANRKQEKPYSMHAQHIRFHAPCELHGLADGQVRDMKVELIDVRGQHGHVNALLHKLWEGLARVLDRPRELRWLDPPSNRLLQSRRECQVVVAKKATALLSERMH
jgi:hypothetical protein